MKKAAAVKVHTAFRKPQSRKRSARPESVAEIRLRLGFSQERFAEAFGISVDTLQNWEQGRREPTGPAKVLIKVASRDPGVVLRAVA